MPESEIRKRGGAKRVRTMKGPTPGTYRRVWVVRKAGKRGGHTVVGPLMRDKGTKGEDRG